MNLLNGENWRIEKTDCIEATMDHLHAMPPASVDMSVFSPPFPSLYAYTSEPCDIGNSDNIRTEAKLHLAFFYNGLRRVLKPGRVAIVHLMQIPRMKRTDEVGLHDFRGTNIRLGERAGLVFEYDWLVRKNPQAQAIRTKSRELQFAGLESDRAKTRGTLGDYLLKFRAPGDNAVKIDSKNQVSRNDWIKWAEACWDDIIETDTLNVAEGRGDDDTKHICPLQLEVIRRCILLFSNPGEIVFSPFAGIGSEGYMALGGISPKTKRQIADPRRFYGCEIKPEYIAAAKVNLAKAERQSQQSSQMLWDVGRASRRHPRVLASLAVSGITRSRWAYSGIDRTVLHDMDSPRRLPASRSPESPHPPRSSQQIGPVAGSRAVRATRTKSMLCHRQVIRYRVWEPPKESAR